MNANPARAAIAWPITLAAAALIGTLASACMMPFVAIAVASAATMRRPQAAITIGGIWAINQILGFGLLGYPLTPYAIAWGIALGGAAVCTMLFAARLANGRRELGVSIVPVFAVAFCAYEAMLFGVALVVGGTGTFTPAIVLQILSNDGLWFAGLMALHLGLTRTAPRVFGAGLSFGPI